MLYREDSRIYFLFAPFPSERPAATPVLSQHRAAGGASKSRSIGGKRAKASGAGEQTALGSILCLNIRQRGPSCSKESFL